MRLSDAGLRRRQSKLLYPNHRLPPWLTEDAITRDRSNRWLDRALKTETGGLRRTIASGKSTIYSPFPKRRNQNAHSKTQPVAMAPKGLPA
jgi:hypothetical protein